MPGDKGALCDPGVVAPVRVHAPVETDCAQVAVLATKMNARILMMAVDAIFMITSPVPLFPEQNCKPRFPIRFRIAFDPLPSGRI